MNLALALAALLAGAEPSPPVDTAIPAPTAIPTPTATSADPQARFDAARAALVADDLATAQRGFEGVAADPAAPPALADAARVLADTCRELSRRGLVPREPGAAVPAGPPRVDRGGRGQLALFSTIYGIFVANALGAISGVENPNAYLGLTLLGGSGGLALSLAGTRTGPISKGRAASIGAATLWTSVNVAALSALADTDGRTATGLTLAGSAAALATTAVLTRERAPTEGDVSLVSSGGAWGATVAALSLTFLDDPSGETAGWMLLGGTDLGLLAGYALARGYQPSQSRVMMVDATALLGAIAGVALPVFSGSEDPHFYAGSTLVGIGAGLALGTYVTRDWDRDDDGAPRAALPAPFATRLADGTLLAGLAGRF